MALLYTVAARLLAAATLLAAAADAQGASCASLSGSGCGGCVTGTQCFYCAASPSAPGTCVSSSSQYDPAACAYPNVFWKNSIACNATVAAATCSAFGAPCSNCATQQPSLCQFCGTSLTTGACIPVIGTACPAPVSATPWILSTSCKDCSVYNGQGCSACLADNNCQFCATSAGSTAGTCISRTSIACPYPKVIFPYSDFKPIPELCNASASNECSALTSSCNACANNPRCQFCGASGASGFCVPVSTTCTGPFSARFSASSCPVVDVCATLTTCATCAANSACSFCSADSSAGTGTCVRTALGASACPFPNSLYKTAATCTAAPTCAALTASGCAACATSAVSPATFGCEYCATSSSSAGACIPYVGTVCTGGFVGTPSTCNSSTICSALISCGSCAAQPGCSFCGATASSGVCQSSSSSCAYPKALFTSAAGCSNFGTCSTYSSCSTCAAASTCEFCGTSSTSGGCIPKNGVTCEGAFTAVAATSCSSGGDPCAAYSGCEACNAVSGCAFCGTSATSGSCKTASSISSSCFVPNAVVSTAAACANLATCASYTSQGCTKCASVQACSYCGSSSLSGTCIPIEGATCRGSFEAEVPSQCSSDICSALTTCTACATNSACSFCGTSETSGFCRASNAISRSCFLPNAIIQSSSSCPKLATCAAYSASGCRTCASVDSCAFCGSSATSGGCIPFESLAFGSSCPGSFYASLSSNCAAGSSNASGSSAPASPLGGIIGGILGAVYQIWLLICVLHWCGCIDVQLVETLMCFPYCCCYPCCCRELYANRRKIRKGKLGRSSNDVGEVIVEQPAGFTAAFPQQPYSQQPYPQQQAPPQGYTTTFPQQQQPEPGRSLTSKW